MFENKIKNGDLYFNRKYIIIYEFLVKFIIVFQISYFIDEREKSIKSRRGSTI